MQSGSALSSWGVATSPRLYARRLAESVNCTTSTTPAPPGDYVDCLRKRSVQELVNVELPGTRYRYLSALGPTVDGRRTVLPAPVRDLMRRNVDSPFASTPLLLGITRDEGQIFLTQSDLDQVRLLTTSTQSQIYNCRGLAGYQCGRSG